ncbi:helix-turn-helix transcriptional regulator [Pedobacter sp. BMA]|uniref:helix-turn-helix domain-containing protein n=1 Tax=Pedobacter sp. BMA TaxID=1663685 RepID=UPI00064A6E8B|nr:helix-turn-helix transcriptional regulator [Pedobacter sp. BMA]KLT67321.1 hypothetical protein AB669_00985 [Pedobacter sp. BMA]
MQENDFVSIWLEETGNPAIEEINRLNMELAEKTATLIEAKHLSANDLAISLDINPDEIQRWLNGRQVFSFKVLENISKELAAF